MKSLSAVIALSVALVVGNSAPAALGELRAGAATADITPKQGVSLDGPISQNGYVTGVHDRLHARALVLDDGNIQLAIVIVDSTMISRAVFDKAKEIAHNKTGIPTARQLMAATHTHATPRATHVGEGPLDDEYHEFLIQRMAAAVTDAHANLAPAKVGWGAFDAPELVKCRRFLCKPGSVTNRLGIEGERIKSVAATSNGVLRPAGPVDPQFSVLSVQHRDGRPLALLGNYSVHYCGGYRRGLVSADYFGYFCECAAKLLRIDDRQPPFVGLMSNGTSGDAGSLQLNAGKKYQPFEQMEEAGRHLAERAVAVAKEIEHRGDVTLAMAETELELSVRRPSAQRLEAAEKLWANAKGKKGGYTWPEVYAREAILLGEMPPTTTIKIQAIRIGELGIAAIPCEVFGETGLAIKKESPLAATFTIELAGGASGYLPTPEQHELGGYETWPARSSHLEVGAEPKIRAAAIRMLNAVAE